MKINAVAVLAIHALLWGLTVCFRCDRRPYGSTTQSSPPDGRFALQVVGAGDTYIPDQLYTVQIVATDDTSRFISFMISLEPELQPDPRNPRRLISMIPGDVRPADNTQAKFSDRCLNSIEHATYAPKSSVEIYWQAPPSGNGCVTLRAMVAENEEVWYEDGAPLTKKICEDSRQPDDVALAVNYECTVCDEAKYEITFTGLWSRNIHPTGFPENEWVPRYSDLVGASHAADFILWAPGNLASSGLRDLAERANSSVLEAEIREKIGDGGVRTMIKGKGHGYRKMSNPTYSFLRADKEHHVFSAVVALYPSPDWFLGVSRFELCGSDGSWILERELSLFPWDAGTDSGVSYESPNFETFPQDAVTRVQMSSYDKNSPFFEVDMKELHPFGKLRIRLVQTYHRECEETTETNENGDNGGDKEPETKEAEPEEPSRYQYSAGDQGGEKPIEPDPEAPEECPMSQWSEWSECEGPCDEDGRVKGYSFRLRYHLVDGVAVEKYDPDARGAKKRPPVPQYCKEKYNSLEEMECEVDCKEGVITAERRRYEPIVPGGKWMSKKRDLPGRVKSYIPALTAY